MLAYAVRRLLQFIPTILAISLIMFFLLNVLPGNAALMAAGAQDRGTGREIRRTDAETLGSGQAAVRSILELCQELGARQIWVCRFCGTRMSAK